MTSWLHCSAGQSILLKYHRAPEALEEKLKARTRGHWIATKFLSRQSHSLWRIYWLDQLYGLDVWSGPKHTMHSHTSPFVVWQFSLRYLTSFKKALKLCHHTSVQITSATVQQRDVLKACISTILVWLPHCPSIKAKKVTKYRRLAWSKYFHQFTSLDISSGVTMSNACKHSSSKEVGWNLPCVIT